MTHLEIKRRIVGTRRDDLVTVPAGDLHDVIVLYEATAERESKLLGLVGESADCLMGDNRDNVPELWNRLDKARRGEL